jgi:hypothetical protein
MSYNLPPVPANSSSPEVYKKWFVEAGEVISSMLGDKRDSYGDNLIVSGQFLKLLYPEGIPANAYPEVLVIIRLFDKLMRIANQHRSPELWTEQETPWLDVAGYAIAIMYDLARSSQLEEKYKFEKDEW